MIVGRNVTQGQTLASPVEAKTLFNIAGDLKRMEIYAQVDESDISKTALGQNATFTVDSFPGRESNAKATQIRKAPQVVQNAVTYTSTKNEPYQRKRTRRDAVSIDAHESSFNM